MPRSLRMRGEGNRKMNDRGLKESNIDDLRNIKSHNPEISETQSKIDRQN